MIMDQRRRRRRRRRREYIGLSCLFLWLTTCATLSLSDARFSRQNILPYTSAPKLASSSPELLPPIVYPPPTWTPPPPQPHEGTSRGLWCVAKPTVPDPIIQEAMDYACASGADCGSIQPGGSCYVPDTLIAHASFAFNSYWQRTKAAGGTCDFQGTALLIITDPSYGECNFYIY